MSKDETKDKALYDANEVRLEDAEFQNGISYVGEDPSTGEFTSTLDRLVFERMSDILTKVLQAKGFSLNIENYLAVIEQTQIGIQATIEDSEHPPYQVHAYSYCMKVPTPSKRASGPLLEKFYNEIKAYEQQILKLKEEQNKIVSQKKTQTVQELRDEIRALKREVDSKTEEIKRLNERLERALSQVGFSDKQIQNMPSLDEGAFRVVKVTDHKLRENKIHLKSKNTSFSYPIKKLKNMPQIGSKCLAFVQDGVVTELFPIDGKSVEFDCYIGDVIDVSPLNIKVRDSNRNLICLPVNKLDHGSLNLKIGSSILINKYKNKVINWKQIKTPFVKKEDKIQEENYSNQLTNKAA